MTPTPTPIVPADPTTFDVFAQLVVPTLLGLAGVAIAFAAWSVARASHALAASITASEARTRSENERRALADRLMKWLYSEFRPAESPRTVRSNEANFESLLERFVLEAELDDDVDDRRFIWTIVTMMDHAMRQADASARSFLAIDLLSSFQVGLRLWVLRPASLRDRKAVSRWGPRLTRAVEAGAGATSSADYNAKLHEAEARAKGRAPRRTPDPFVDDWYREPPS